ncbi:MAG: Hint domain-containing protein [Rubellimicrobium sp.]|nr:Hint domain-containing protein [Rubellimicrobium sp.]
MQAPVAEPAASADLTTITLCAGARILTLAGELAVEDLVPGAKIITRDTGTARLESLSVSHGEVGVIHIKAGSLGQARPERDADLPADTAMHLRDWRAGAAFGATVANVKADVLVDGDCVTRQDAAQRRLVTLTFSRPHVIYIDGMELAVTA